MNPIAANPAAPETERLYPIRTVAQLTQVNPITLRAWERRYNLIRPIRTPAGHRLYSDADIRRIREILDLSEQGIGLAQIAAIVTQRAAAATAPPIPPRQTARPSREPRRPTPPPQTADRESWSARLETAVRHMDSTAVTQIEQEALLWLPLGQLFDSVLLPALSRLEQPDAQDGQELARHWFSEHLRARLHGMLEGQQYRPSTAGKPQVGVDQFDGPRPFTAAEFQFLLLLGTLMQVRLSPATLSQAQTAELMGTWHPDGWVRLALPHAAGSDVISAARAERKCCPDTMVIPCAVHNDTSTENGNDTNDVGNLVRGTADQCCRRIFERLRRK